MPGAEDPDDDREKHAVEFSPGLSDAQRAETERIFAALRATRGERHRRADEAAAAGGAADATPPMLPLCPVVLASGAPCLLPLVDEQACPHREPGPAPAALTALIGELRREVAEARQVASTLASGLRYRRGDRGVEAVLRREQPWWLVPGEPGWPPA